MYHDKQFYRPRPVVPLGKIYATANAHAQLTSDDINKALDRHICGDWGNVCDEDWLANDEALIHEGRLLSSYKSSNGVTFWIITEWDRTITTVLLPEDY